ncbi:ribonuclease H-like domain-containing protein [Tanacetum coccineum]
MMMPGYMASKTIMDSGYMVYAGSYGYGNVVTRLSLLGFITLVGCARWLLDLFRLLGRWWNIQIPSFVDSSTWEAWFNGVIFSSLQKQRLRIDQYFQVQDYSLWDVIENGNSFKPTARTKANADGTSTSMIPGPVTTEEKAQKKNDVKARKSLDSIFNRLQKIVSQLAILGENISQEDLNLKFLRSLPSKCNTHVVVWINKSDLDIMCIDDLYNNFKIVEQEVKRTSISNSSSQNMAFVSYPNSTNEVNTTNVQVSTANSPVSTADTPDSTANLSDATVYAFLAKLQIALSNKVFLESTSRRFTNKWSDTAGYDKSKVECFNYHKIGHFTRECRGPRNQDNRNMNQDSSRRTVEETSTKAMTQNTSFKDSKIDALKSEIKKLKKEKESNQIKIDKFENASKSLDKLIGSQISDNSRKGVGFVSYNAVPPPPTGLFVPPTIDLSNSSIEEFQQPQFKGYGPKASKSVCKGTFKRLRKLLMPHWVRS